MRLSDDQFAGGSRSPRVTRSGRRYAFDAGLAARELQQQGGFSHQRTTGAVPRSGWMVSQHGSEEIVPGHASPRQIDEYRQAHPNPVARPRQYVGGWYDEGKTYLDQSVNVRSAAKAHAMGREHAQRAIYDVGRSEVYRVHHAGRIDVRGSLFEGQGMHRQLREGESEAARERTESNLNRRRFEAVTLPEGPSKPQGQQLRFRGM